MIKKNYRVSLSNVEKAKEIAERAAKRAEEEIRTAQSVRSTGFIHTAKIGKHTYYVNEKGAVWKLVGKKLVRATEADPSFTRLGKAIANQPRSKT